MKKKKKLAEEIGQTFIMFLYDFKYESEPFGYPIPENYNKYKQRAFKKYRECPYFYTKINQLTSYIINLIEQEDA